VGGFDEVNLQVGFNGIDLVCNSEISDIASFGCFLRNFSPWSPYRVGTMTSPELFKLGSVWREFQDSDAAKRERGLRKWKHMHQTWGTKLDGGDPYHNSNLLFDLDYLEISSAPRRLKPRRTGASSSGVTGVQEHAGLTRREGFRSDWCSADLVVTEKKLASSRVQFGSSLLSNRFEQRIRGGAQCLGFFPADN
jgi:hypothetical protein